jgi:hypothetical protein
MEHDLPLKSFSANTATDALHSCDASAGQAHCVVHLARPALPETLLPILLITGFNDHLAIFHLPDMNLRPLCISTSDVLDSDDPHNVPFISSNVDRATDIREGQTSGAIDGELSFDPFLLHLILLAATSAVGAERPLSNNGARPFPENQAHLDELARPLKAVPDKDRL